MTIELDFESNDSAYPHGAIYSAEWHGFTVNIYQDSSPECPWTAWDCEPPLLAYSDRRLTEYGDASELHSPLSHISDGKLQRHQRAICDILDMDWTQFHSDALESQRDYGGSLVDIKREALEEALNDKQPDNYGGNASDYFDVLQRLWELAGYEAIDTSSHGYTQSCYADLLIVATPDWIKQTGAPRDSHRRQLESAAKLWSYWAWGNVYGYEIEDSDGEHVDSCWGFYSDDIDGQGFHDSGMADYCLNALQHEIDTRRKARQSKLGELIRANVPLAVRADILATMPGVQA